MKSHRAKGVSTFNGGFCCCRRRCNNNVKMATLPSPAFACRWATAGARSSLEAAAAGIRSFSTDRRRRRRRAHGDIRTDIVETIDGGCRNGSTPADTAGSDTSAGPESADSIWTRLGNLSNGINVIIPKWRNRGINP